MTQSKKIFFSISFLFTFMMLWSACGGGNSSTEKSSSENVTKTEKIASKGGATDSPEIEKTKEPTPEVETKEEKKEEEPKVEEPKKEEKPKAKKPVKKAPAKRAKMHFPEKVFDYGFIMQGDTVKHDFYFKNVGNDDLLIKKVSPSCGCTVPIYPKEPIAPGEDGKISVTFNSAGKLGRQVPTITVLTNYRRNIKLELKGYVDAERAKPPQPVEEKKDTTQL